MLEKLSAQAIYYRPRSDGPTGILNAGLEGACFHEKYTVHFQYILVNF